MAPHCASLSQSGHEYRRPPPPGTPANSLLIDAVALVMMGEEEWGWRSATLTPCCVLQVWRVKHGASERLLCCTLFSFSTCSGGKKMDAVFYMHQLISIMPPPSLHPNTSQASGESLHTASQLCIVTGLFRSQLKESDRESGVSVLYLQGRQGLKKKLLQTSELLQQKKKAPKHLQNTSVKEARARSLYCLSPHPPKYCKPAASKQASESLTLPLRDNSSLHYHSRRLSKKA